MSHSMREAWCQLLLCLQDGSHSTVPLCRVVTVSEFLRKLACRPKMKCIQSSDVSTDKDTYLLDVPGALSLLNASANVLVPPPALIPVVPLEASSIASDSQAAHQPSPPAVDAKSDSDATIRVVEEFSLLSDSLRAMTTQMQNNTSSQMVQIETLSSRAAQIAEELHRQKLDANEKFGVLQVALSSLATVNAALKAQLEGLKPVRCSTSPS